LRMEISKSGSLKAFDAFGLRSAIFFNDAYRAWKYVKWRHFLLLIRIHMAHHHYTRRYRLGLTVTKRPAHIDGPMDGWMDGWRSGQTPRVYKLSCAYISSAEQMTKRATIITNLTSVTLKSRSNQKPGYNVMYNILARLDKNLEMIEPLVQEY
jgi:hypothetical protein